MIDEALSPLGPTRPHRGPTSRRDILSSVVTAAAVTGAAAPALAQGTTSANLRFINPSTIAKPPGYTHVIEVTGPGRTVYIAGQTGRDATGKLAGAPGEFGAQATQAFENLKHALAAVDASFEHVVKLNNYLKANPPASTTVQVSKLARDDLLFEVEAIAILPPK